MHMLKTPEKNLPKQLKITPGIGAFFRKFSFLHVVFRLKIVFQQLICKNDVYITRHVFFLILLIFMLTGAMFLCSVQSINIQSYITVFFKQTLPTKQKDLYLALPWVQGLTYLSGLNMYHNDIRWQSAIYTALHRSHHFQNASGLEKCIIGNCNGQKTRKLLKKYCVSKYYVLRSTYRNIFIILFHSVH